MKKFVLAIVIVIVSVNVSHAQKRIGQWSFIPRVGMNMNNISDMDVSTTDNVTHKSAIRPDFTFGADAEYQVTDMFSVSAGAFYSRQGCRWSKYSEPIDEYEEKGVKYTVELGYEDQSLKLQYLNIPLMANYYINKYFAIHAGLQCGFALGDGKWDYAANHITVNQKTGERTYGSTEKVSSNQSDLRKVVMSIPLGASFEYEKVIIDVRYAFPLSKFCKPQEGSGVGNGSNRVLAISIGYRL